MRLRVAGLIRYRDKLLLVNHVKGYRSYWLLPGGGVREGESIDRALARELFEELGLDELHFSIGDVVLIVESIGPSRHVVNLIMEVHLPEDLFARNLDGDRWRWSSEDPRVVGARLFSSSELETLEIHPPINEELRAYLSGKPFKRIYIGARWRP